ncbi:PHD finger protein 3 isoform X2 [Dasypus novemcinctus]|uniref:PHD finger protein 3 isoform X2 n=1 Tax=Dasypus novemcinctus TaxID=9361 RepID=UPI00265DCE07|nr:PHD finger protein 3 isoform X2 [Dasypus novemcinctus]XP_058162913.1 PHD finger protein 3 isoform X2 [Dasypus novemcinctus]
MDIVDTFNHLIPTEHLDDALFLGSNLENEVCEDFSTSQNVLEDSLKNMLSDKDPMLGSASNQFCLPVLDSNDPNFQMPCSTEQVRSLRQSTIAKRSNAAPLSSTKKASGKTLTAPKALVKQPERCQIKEEVSTSLKPEYHKESRRSTRHIGQVEVVPEGPVSSSHSSLSSCIEMKNEAELDSKHKCNNQEEANVPSNELNCPLLSETHANNEEKKDETLMECKVKMLSNPLFKFSDKEEHEQNDSISNKMDETIVEEMRAKGKVEQESKETVTLSHEGDQIVEEPGSSVALSGDAACTNKIEKNLVGLSCSVDEVTECNLELNTMEVADKAKNSLQKNKKEPLGYCKDTESNDKQLQNTEFNKSNLEIVDATAFEAENNILENVICDAPDQNSKQDVGSIKMESCETSDLQDDRNSQLSNSSCLESKNVKFKHTKPTIHSKQNMTMDTPKKIVAAKHEVIHNKAKVNVKTVKRNADEPESQQNFHRPVKVRKKVDKDLKIQSCNFGVKSVKNQAHSVLKKTLQDQNLVQLSKPLTHSLSDKLHGHPGCSKEPHHPAQTGHLLHSSQKQCHKPQQQAPAMRTNSYVKEELEHTGVEHFKEEDKLKLKKTEKNLQPRQRRSSKSFSLDEPPLFIPDNISTIKREGSDHSSSFESKYVWTPSKQCGFCKKPHGNRFMVGCGRCDDWFHGDCVGLSLSQAQQMGEEDKEYVCVKCCAEEDKKTETLDPDTLENQAKFEIHSEDKTVECEKLVFSKHTPTNDKTKYMDDTVKHKVKILKRESGEGKNLSECRDNEIKKWQLAPLRKMGQPVLPRRSSEEKSEKMPKESTTVICTGEKASKPGAQEKQEIKKKKAEKGGVPNVHPPAASTSKPSADQIRQSVRHSLKDILMKRLTDSNLKVPEEKAAKVATKIEKELFSFFRDTDAKYKNKYRSLMFNLKDPKNNILFKKVLKGEVTPDHLIRMSPEELASKELAAWRQRENRHTIEMIEKEQREVERRPITKITHKGEIEIESDAPMKEQEAAMEIQEPTTNKSLEKIEESEKQKEEIDSMSKDTTSQHRQHLFDLNCKICIGRMAPPVDDLSPKKVKVVVGVARKHSDNEAESIADALSSTSNFLGSEFFEEEKQESPKSTFSPAPRPEMPGTVEVESTFLARLNFIWKGFINMPSVAKFVTKAYPVSGSPEYLTEDLPDSIQVGGRISPQTVWDYVEKIKASGTKEICVVRFTPVTEEDQISYTLLFAYFSSRKRYGVAANNMKQVKDMYLIPLGSTDKIPHPLVPFDGPGLELHRPNLLLGLIIRQKLKRQHSASASLSSEAPESVPMALPPDKKSKIEVSTEEAPEEENDFFNSFTTVLHKQRNKPQQTLQEDLPTAVEPLVEVTKQEPPKPLRFLPGVLIGWENQPSTLELANKPLPVDDILQSLLGTTSQVYEQDQSVIEQSSLKEIPFINEHTNLKAEKIDKVEVTDTEAKEVKVKSDNLSDSADNSVVVVEETSVVGSSSISPGPLASLSLRGKPPDVSTEAFLTNLSIQSKQEETVDSKERTLKRQLLQDQESNLQDNRTPNTSSPCISNVGKGNIDGNVSCSENLVANTRSPQFINLKRDPRQAAGRSQQIITSDTNDGDSCRNGEKHPLPGLTHNKEHLTEQINVEENSSVEKNSCVQQTDNARVPQNSPSVENIHTSQTEQAKPLQEDTLMQNIETVHPFRRGSAVTTAHFEVGNTCQSEFPSKSINFTSRSTSPRTSANFSPVRPQQPNLQHLKSSPPGFPFPGPPNFPPQNMFGFPPHLPPPLLPPPGFGFAQNPMVPWPPVVHLTGQPQRMMGPLSQASRYIGPQNFYQVKDIRRPERRHSDPWGRQDQQQLDRQFNRGKGDRQRFYSDSHHLKRERHEKEWEQESERHRRRDRIQDKDRDRKNREEGHKDKERARLSHSDRGADGKASRDNRNVDKKPDKPKSEDHEKDKEREKSKHREGEKERDRYHKDRDHTDRAKSKR